MVCTRHRVSERRACRVLGQARTTQRYRKRVREEETPLRARIIQLASDYGGYGIPRILDLLRKRAYNGAIGTIGPPRHTSERRLGFPEPCDGLGPLDRSAGPPTMRGS